MVDGKPLSWEGIQLVWVVLGVVGAALGIGSMPEMSKRQLWMALGSGVISAGYGPQWVNYGFMHWTPSWINATGEPMPSFMLGTAAFIFGIGGLFLVPGVIAFWQDPLGALGRILDFLNRLRGGAKP